MNSGGKILSGWHKNARHKRRSEPSEKGRWHFRATHFGARPIPFPGRHPAGNIEVMRPMYEPRTRAFLIVLSTMAFLLTLVGAGLKITLQTYFVAETDSYGYATGALDQLTTFFAVVIAALCGVLASVLVAARRAPQPAETASDLPS